MTRKLDTITHAQWLLSGDLGGQTKQCDNAWSQTIEPYTELRMQKQIVDVIRRNKALVAAGVLGVSLMATAYARPAAAACVFATNDEFSDQQIALLADARTRITETFGAPVSTPQVFFFNSSDSLWLLRKNNYGSTTFLGYKTCVSIGPKGQNVDVVAHELMHTEIEHRIGFWTRTMKLPVWFDEGLAMQVDFRERYDLPVGAQSNYVTQLDSSSQFYRVSRDQFIMNYAAAKAEVQRWVGNVKTERVYGFLQQMKRNRSFSSLWRS